MMYIPQDEINKIIISTIDRVNQISIDALSSVLENYIEDEHQAECIMKEFEERLLEDTEMK